MLNRFKHIIEEMRGQINDGNWSPPCGNVLLAVSGGIDSMCLADLYYRCFGPDGFALAHCNFHLRGADSDADAVLVAQWAEERGVRVHMTDFDTQAYASEEGVSIEMAARELRYRWFASVCEEHGYKAVVVAHHADDNAETLVLNMVRGAGLKGLSGMKPISRLPYGGDALLLRPLLTFTRKQIEGHVMAWKVPYREDCTNSSVEYRRNSVRHEVFPLLERMNPSFIRTLNREMSYFTSASGIVEQWCKENAGNVCSYQEDGCRINIDRLVSVPHWKYLLYHILEPYGFNSSALESLESLLVSERTISGKRFDSPTHVAMTERGELVVRKQSVSRVVMDNSTSMPVRAAGFYHINGNRVQVEVLSWTPDMPLKQPEGVLIMDADKLRFPFILRGWAAGDWLIPFGMRGKKKISDLFSDLKYGHLEKESAVVVVDCSMDKDDPRRVAALLAKRIDDKYKVTHKTRNVVRLTLVD